MASLVLDPFDHHAEGSARSGNSQQQSQEYSQQGAFREDAVETEEALVSGGPRRTGERRARSRGCDLAL